MSRKTTLAALFRAAALAPPPPRRAATDTAMLVHALCAALAGQRFPLEDEKRTQAAIAARLHACGWDVAREVPLTGAQRREYGPAGATDIGFAPALGVIDFLVAGGIGVEVKLKGSTASICRQLVRYAEDPRLRALVLVTAKAVAVPPVLAPSGKRLSVVDLGRAWL